MAFCSSNSTKGVAVPKPKCFEKEMFVKEKCLLGPGPSNPSERVLRSLSRPVMGHLHPETLKVRNIPNINFSMRKILCKQH